MKYRFTLLLTSLLSLSAASFAQYWQINTFAGLGTAGFSGDGGIPTNAEMHGPVSIAIDKNNNVYFVDFFNLRVRKISNSGIITTIAGIGTGGYGGDGSIGTSANLNPDAVAVNKKGEVYISDAQHSVIRKVNTLGIISTVAGMGVPGYSGDGGPALSAHLNYPHGMAFDSIGNLYIADGRNNAIRKVDTFGFISTIAGIGTAGFTGDGGPATAAQLDSPYAIALDEFGQVFIADYLNNVIRKVDTDGIISTFAGNTFMAYSGDGGPAALASFRRPCEMTFDSVGNLYIADIGNNVIRRIDTFKVITTVVGTGTFGFGGDLGPAIGANLYAPNSVAFDRNGIFYIADANNQRIRKVYRSNVSVLSVSSAAVNVYPNPASGTITVAGCSAGDDLFAYDAAGRQVAAMQSPGSSTTLELAHLPAGVYTLAVYSAGSRKATVTVVKQ